jgi:hypothetical protein
LSNPYTFGYFEPMKHETKVPRFTHNWLTYQGGALPHEYEGKIFACNPLLAQVTLSERIPEGSTFRTRDIGTAIASTDKWFRPVDIKLGLTVRSMSAIGTTSKSLICARTRGRWTTPTGVFTGFAGRMRHR